MLVPGLLLLLVGLFYIVPRGGLSGSAATRTIGLGMQGVHQTPGDSPQEFSKRPWFKSLMGALAIIAGGLLVHFATN